MQPKIKRGTQRKSIWLEKICGKKTGWSAGVNCYDEQFVNL